MSTQDNLNNANELGRTIAALIGQPYGLTANITKVVENLVAALADRAQQLLNPPEIKASSPADTDIVLKANETMTITGNGEVTIRGDENFTDPRGTPTAAGPTPEHAPDCSIYNDAVPEIVWSCDCTSVDENYGHFPDLHAYLAKAEQAGVIDHVVRVVLVDGNRVGAYIRPMNTSGDTMSFNVLGDMPKIDCAQAI